jgi:hypothetical protein
MLQSSRWPLVQLHQTRLIIGIVAEAAPEPWSGLKHQATLHRILMHVAQLHRPFARTPHIEIIKAGLPDMRGVVIVPKRRLRGGWPTFAVFPLRFLQRWGAAKVQPPSHLKRYYGAHHLHFITFTFYHRQPRLARARRRDLFLKILEQVRQRYDLVVVGYVVMPEHIHLLISEPEKGVWLEWGLSRCHRGSSIPPANPAFLNKKRNPSARLTLMGSIIYLSAHFRDDDVFQLEH